MQYHDDGLVEELLIVESGLDEVSLEANVPNGLYIAGTLVWDCWQVPVRTLNATVITRISRKKPT